MNLLSTFSDWDIVISESFRHFRVGATKRRRHYSSVQDG